MTEGNRKGSQVVEGSYRVVETTKTPDGEVKINASPQPDTGSRQEVKKTIWQKIFGKKTAQERADAAIKKADDTLNRLSARTDIEETIARQTTKNRINEMNQALGLDPRYSDDVNAELERMKKERGIK